MKNKYFPIIIIVISILTELASTDILLPALPVIKHYFSADVTLVSLLISCNLFGLAVSGLIYGWLSDYLGRKPIFLFGNIVFLCGSIFCIFSQGIISLIIARFIQGIGGGVCATLGLAILRDQYDEKQYLRIISWVGILLTSSPAIFPLLGGYLSTHYFWQVNFYLIVASSLLVTPIVYYYLPESLVKNPKSKLLLSSLYSNYKEILTNKQFLYPAMICALTYASTWVYLAILPLYIVNVLHLPPTKYGLLIAFNVCASFLGTILHNFCVSRLTSNKLLQIGIMFLMVSGLTFIPVAWLNKQIWLIIIVESIYWIGISFVFPSASELALNRMDHRRGVASSALISFEMLAGSLAVALGSMFYHETMMPVAVLTLLISLIVLFIHYGIKRHVTFRGLSFPF